MNCDRRRFLIRLGSTSMALGCVSHAASAQEPQKKSVPDFPNAATFRTGDLVWPKRKGAIVPRTRSLQAAPNRERREWEAAREQMLANPGASGLSPEVAERLRAMTYEEFEAFYFSTRATQAPNGKMRSFDPIGGIVSVGHVGFIEIDPQGVPHIVEATPKRIDGTVGGVIRVPYTDWLKSYTNVQVWHGRFRDLNAAASRKVVDVAKSQLGKPYDFFNFDLDDDRGFYCSKLVWLSVWRALKIAADDNPDPHRGNRFPPWFAPKTLLGAKRISLLHSPGEY